MFGKNKISILKFSFGIIFILALVFGLNLYKGANKENKNDSSNNIVLTDELFANPLENEELYMDKGDNCFQKGEYSKAIDNYLKALKLNSLNHVAAYNIGESLEKLDLIREAIKVHKLAKEIRAKKDCYVIADAIKEFHKDTGTWPFYNECYVEGENRISKVDFLYGNMGNIPGFASGVASSWGLGKDYVGEDIYYSLITNGTDCPWYKEKPPSGVVEDEKGWDGPYLPYLSEDPWGFKFVVSVGGFEDGKNPSNHVWCISAGPNYNIDTPASFEELYADDIGVKIE